MGNGHENGATGTLSIDVVTIKHQQHPFYVLKGVGNNGKWYTIAGRLPDRVFEGDHLTGTFTHEEHPEYGKQLKPLSVKVVHGPDPDFVDGVARLLEKELYGVGPVTARAIVSTFGRDTFSALENPELLQQVPNIGEAKAKEIAKTWRDISNNFSSFLPLLELGLSPRQAEAALEYFVAIEDLYGYLVEDIYRLMRIPGIGFKTADKIALTKLGYPPDDPRRLKAAIGHIAWTALSYGDTAFTLVTLTRIGKKQLGLKESDINKGLALALENRILINERGKYALPFAFAIEQDIANAVRSFQNAKLSRLPRIKLPDSYTLTELQAATLKQVLTNPISYLTGLPGTGKSFTVGALAAAFRAAGVSVLGLAPTGKAAIRLRRLNMPASTVHKVLGYIPETAHWPEPPETTPNTIEADVVILDEASMADISLFRAILRSSRPGKTRILLVGDPNQLPPVGPGEPFTNLLEHLPGIHLTEVFRQAAGNPVVKAAHELARGNKPVDSGDARFRLIMTSEEKLEKENLLRAYADMWDTVGMRPQLLVPGNKGQLGVISLNAAIKPLVNPGNDDEGVEIGGGGIVHSGDPVIMTRNDYQLEVMNGEQGIVVDVEDVPGTRRLVVDFAGKYVFFTTRKQQRTLLPAYAISVHRSQGSQWPAVMVVLTTGHYMLLNRESLYTAITRAERFTWLWGSSKALSIAVKNRASHRSTWLPTFLEKEAS